MKQTSKTKRFSVSRLPGLFKKTYPEKKLDKKIYAKLFIEQDRIFVKSFFQPVLPEKKEAGFRIPADTVLTKEQFKRLLLLSKQIKRQKGRFKAAPFIAVAVVLAGSGLAVSLFKNTIVKEGIKKGMEASFGAQCDIKTVSVRLFDASLFITGLAQTDPDHLESNLFEIQKIAVDFNLTQALRGRFDAQNLEISGIAFHTKRAAAGTLVTNSKKTNDTSFDTSLQEKKAGMVSGAGTYFSSLADSYDPQSVIQGMSSQLSSPAVARQAEAQMDGLLSVYKEKPAELEKQVTDFKEQVQTVSKINVRTLKTPAAIQSAIAKVSSAAEAGKDTQRSVSEAAASIKKDSAAVTALTKSLESAVKEDTKLIHDKTAGVSSLSVSDGSRFITGYLDSAAYELLGKYYPFLKKAVQTAGALKKKDSSKSTAAEITEKKQHKRLAGRTLSWKKDTVPTFLIEQAHASGSGLQAVVTDISNDMDKRGRPAVADISYKSAGKQDIVHLVVDARSSSSEPLISGRYGSSGRSLVIDPSVSGITPVTGVPVFRGTAVVSAAGTAESDGSFTLSGSLLLDPVTITTASFSPESVSVIYQNVLSSFSSLTVQGSASYAVPGGISLSVTSDADRKAAAALQSYFAKETARIQSETADRIQNELVQQTGGARDKINQFQNIRKMIDSDSTTVSGLNNELTAKNSELQKALKDQAAAGVKAAGSDAAAALKKLF